jgi:hypothetical protein
VITAIVAIPRKMNTRVTKSPISTIVECPLISVTKRPARLNSAAAMPIRALWGGVVESRSSSKR